jgi:hypothetical protein
MEDMGAGMVCIDGVSEGWTRRVDYAMGGWRWGHTGIVVGSIEYMEFEK